MMNELNLCIDIDDFLEALTKFIKNRELDAENIEVKINKKDIAPAEIAVKMLMKGMDVETVSRCTGFRIDDLREIERDIALNSKQEDPIYKIATNMINEGISLDDVTKFTGLSVNDLEELIA